MNYMYIDHIKYQGSGLSSTFYVRVAEVDCGYPPDIFPNDANTYWSLLSSSVTVSSSVVGTVYRYDCRAGYKNRLVPHLSYLGIECKADGQWQSCCNNDCIREYTHDETMTSVYVSVAEVQQSTD